MNVEKLKIVMNAISSIMNENKDYLVSLDAQNGDGDLGISMAAGFASVAKFLEDENSDTDLGKVFMKMSGVLNENAPSSLGTILSIIMSAMARALKGKEEASIKDFGLAMESGVNSVMEKTKSKIGEKTILDSLLPAIDVLKSSDGLDAIDVLKNASEKAKEGSEATKNMKAVHGRR